MTYTPENRRWAMALRRIDDLSAVSCGRGPPIVRLDPCLRFKIKGRWKYNAVCPCGDLGEEGFAGRGWRGCSCSSAPLVAKKRRK